MIWAALATCIPFLLLIGYLAWGQVSRQRDRVEREALAQAGLVSAQVEKHFGARVEAVGGCGRPAGGRGGEPVGRRGAGAPAEAGLSRTSTASSCSTSWGWPRRRCRPWRRASGSRSATRSGSSAPRPRPSPSWAPPGEGDPRSSSAIYAPVRTPEGQLRGVLAVDLVLKRAQDLLGQVKSLPGTVAALVTDRGVVVARQPTALPHEQRGRAARLCRSPGPGRRGGGRVRGRAVPDLGSGARPAARLDRHGRAARRRR